MPYSINDVPNKIKDLPDKARKIWITAFNAAYTEYKKDDKANQAAWTAVKSAGYEQNEDGKWKRWE